MAKEVFGDPVHQQQHQNKLHEQEEDFSWDLHREAPVAQSKRRHKSITTFRMGSLRSLQLRSVSLIRAKPGPA